MSPLRARMIEDMMTLAGLALGTPPSAREPSLLRKTSQLWSLELVSSSAIARLSRVIPR